ncbi:hypothetical protein [Corynebacterium variabile]|uniref:hypothetical protein n=1 Tax=Corynebacterium variabile TaxID=1727 RepID=UPI003A914C39
MTDWVSAVSPLAASVAALAASFSAFSASRQFRLSKRVLLVDRFAEISARLSASFARAESEILGTAKQNGESGSSEDDINIFFRELMLSASLISCEAGKEAKFMQFAGENLVSSALNVSKSPWNYAIETTEAIWRAVRPNGVSDKQWNALGSSKFYKFAISAAGETVLPELVDKGVISKCEVDLFWSYEKLMRDESAICNNWGNDYALCPGSTYDAYNAVRAFSNSILEPWILRVIKSNL